MDTEIRIGLVGCGGIANGLYLPGIADIPRAEVVALCDISPERLEATSQRWSVFQTYTDLGEMLAQSDIDLLINTTPIQAHYKLNLQAVEAGVNVYTEKSMTITVEEADRLIEAARANGVLLASAPDMMVRPGVSRLRELVASQAVGPVVWAQVRSSHGGPDSFPTRRDPSWFYQPGAGPILDMGVYGLHLITGLLGPARRVTAFSARSRPLRRVRRGPLKGLEVKVEIDDNVLILLDFSDSVLAFVDSGYCVPGSRTPQMELFGTDGTLSFNGYSADPPFEIFMDDMERGVRGWITPDGKLPQPETRAMGVAHVVDCLLNQEELILTPEHARHVIEIMNKAQESARQGKALELETAFPWTS
ncbi:MAG: Gfo/Idh/MocA family oxidoreductase [Chloroflexota bacterium]|nr:Gfo/Idh/MocA family oxidoreductase [Chloroflexota bacterium]